MNPNELKLQLKAEANRLGFSLFGVATATDADGFERFTSWLGEGYHGEMDYLAKRRDARRSPASVLASVRSVVMLGFEYGQAVQESYKSLGRVAAYARGPDYHGLIWEKLNALGSFLQTQDVAAEFRGVTDSAPLLEREFARRAGLGWFGKNTMLINKHRGSFFFLAGFLTNLDLPADEPYRTNHCGTCTACLDACPTDAFVTAGTLDARKCISYLTIESKSAFPLELRPAVRNWLFGCDVCQEVCPWNRHAGKTPVPFPADAELVALDPLELLAMSEAEFRTRFKPTPLFRPKWSGLRRNAAIVLGNVGDEKALPILACALADVNEVVREAATWAIDQIRERQGTGAPQPAGPDRPVAQPAVNSVSSHAGSAIING
ncbi:tRNA epoxyqueuosine(34) reductase QueG [Limnoglobus roseus]|uniref:tRNA epoxyqueuosine(34) reductase QueG n=1 Tax=Limnoglobus roseus TaxID=2598579 RepID=A0A5C1ANK0_9BACT|nr:tRNA epoxyqueuosine(34) reductase QueG [Limnoglobus roseus]QEL18794.1 tRNA epoxyqueuosine(34) reductase QueG [Limnoglobus roseus]